MPWDSTIVVFSKHLQWLSYERLGETVADIGFDGVDLTVRAGGHVAPERVEEDLPRAVEAVRRSGGEVIMITTSIQSVADPHAERVLKTAAGLGIHLYRMGWLQYEASRTIEENLADFTSQLQELSDLNRRCSIVGAYQNHAGTWVGASVWDLGLLLKAVNSEWLGCQYDVRHAMVEGTSSWIHGLRLISPHINSLVIKDFAWRQLESGWEACSVPLGKGAVRFTDFIGMLRQRDVMRPVCLHFEYPLGGAESGARRLSISPEDVTRAMRRDLEYVKGVLA